ncbi:hypothetical protein RHSIM_Rhsim03G0014600 [Rhododendron simsii]|uniref:Uncharacterized protein n=1 Tax=Rhododendron simsii TaxID=118357 RepID=A0A834H7Y4_RHOSS|nr:hypothetical protein RHSIM_Rhsim03G0014600 [Rhododendron simsii]
MLDDKECYCQDVLLSKDAALDSGYHVMRHFGLWFVLAANGSMSTAVVVIFGVSVYSHVDDTFRPEEITTIMSDFAKPRTLAPTGLYLGGTKYTVIDPRRSRGCHKRKEGNYEALQADEALRHYFFHDLVESMSVCVLFTGIWQLAFLLN